MIKTKNAFIIITALGAYLVLNIILFTLFYLQTHSSDYLFYFLILFLFNLLYWTLIFIYMYFYWEKYKINAVEQLIRNHRPLQTFNIDPEEYVERRMELQRAVTNKEFLLYFQPQLHLPTNKIQSVEALIRWKHPRAGIIQPDKFIPIAEESGVIKEIGEWALYEACAINKIWHSEYNLQLTVSVNVSPAQFYYQDIYQIIANALATSHLNPHYLEIEITETTMMEDIDVAIKILNEVHDLGVRIAIDDFGKGYTSINYLKKIPVSILKIDKTFIDGIPNDPHDIAITSGIIDLSHKLKLSVIAEGVQNIDQFNYLRDEHCDYIQGAYILEPVTAKQIPIYIKP